jgi:hypothetical protein
VGARGVRPEGNEQAGNDGNEGKVCEVTKGSETVHVCVLQSVLLF